MKILIVNGPNLNLLGTREPGIYGYQTMPDCLHELREAFPEMEIDYYQSNHEGDLIDCLQQAVNYDGIVINAGGYSHTSIAIADCIRAITVPVVEVHISNISAREEMRHFSLLTPACEGMISGLGMSGYRLAVRYFAEK